MRSLQKYIALTGALIVLSSSALALGASPAGAATPTGEYAAFKECPLANAEVNECIYSKTTGGEVKIASTSVPIKNPITLQGGQIVNEETFTETFVPAANGETLSKTAQPVPGGLLGLVRCNEISNFIERAACEVVFENGVTGVNATTELVGAVSLNESALVEEVGTALVLPVRIHLENPLLGSGCYIGSASKPVTLHLTTGRTNPPPPNTPIKGATGNIEFREEGSLLVITGNSLVDNAFAVPAAEGCGGIFSFLIDPIIDAKLSLPSAAGHNTAILNGTIKQAAAGAVRKSE
ncbi:MAG: hypothetical protein ACYCUM_12720 [Solirubrobacteraceae bacterium]